MNLPSDDILANQTPNPRLRGTESSANTYGLTRYMLDKHPTSDEIARHIKAHSERSTTMPFFRHGNYAGPGWSDGKRQDSVAGSMLAASDLDQMSRDHDAAFSTKDSETIKKANAAFIKAAFSPSTDVRTKLAGLAVLIASKVSPTRYGGRIEKLKSDSQVRASIKPKTIKNHTKTKQKHQNMRVHSLPAMAGKREVATPLLTGLDQGPRINNGQLKTASGRKIDMRPLVVAVDIPSPTTIIMSTKQQPKPANRRRQTSASPARGEPTRATAPLNTSRLITIPKAKLTTINGVTSVKHSEYFRPVFGTTAFAVASNSINPALQNFPWLSTIAGSYQKYKFTSLKFRYVASCAATVGGRICMAHQLDPVDPMPPNKGAMFQITPNVEVSVWKETSISVNQKGTSLFTRYLTVPDTDLKTYDYGNLVLSTDNCTTTGIIGDLFVDYVVQLFDPQPSPEVGGQLDTTTPYLAHPFRSSSVTGPSPVFPTADGDLIFPNMGTYMVAIYLVGTGIVSVNTPTSTGATITGKFATINTAATEASCVFIVNVTIANAIVLYTPTVATLTRVFTLATKAALIMGS